MYSPVSAVERARRVLIGGGVGASLGSGGGGSGGEGGGVTESTDDVAPCETGIVTPASALSSSLANCLRRKL